jgi:hypothetical protein
LEDQRANLSFQLQNVTPYSLAWGTFWSDALQQVINYGREGLDGRAEIVADEYQGVIVSKRGEVTIPP